MKRKWLKTAIPSIWHAHCYTMPVHLVPRHEGAVQRFSGPAAPPLLHSDFRADQLLQLAALEHLHHDVRPADELTLDVELGDRRPIRIFLDALADLRILQNVDRLIWRTEALEDGNRAARKAALREQRRSLHEQDDLVGFDEVGDAGLGVTHLGSPYSAPRSRAAVREALPLLAPRAPHRPPGAV